jgi:hypothetical protein
MQWWRGLVFAVICAVALQWTAASQPHVEARSETWPLLARSVDEQAAPANRILRNASVGFRLTYPRSWKVVRQVVATEFAVGAACQSVHVIDLQPPPNSGPGAKVLQSLVQVCWKRLSGRESLAEFVERTYGGRASGLLERTELGGVPAYRTKGNGLNATIFLQTDAHRIQIVAAVVAEPQKRIARQAQVQRILASFSVTP